MYPRGYRVTSSYNGTHVTVVFFGCTRRAKWVEDSIARMCVLAVSAVSSTGRRSDTNRYEDVCVLIQTQNDYEKHRPLGLTQPVAYVGNMRFVMGWRPYPLVVMHERYLSLLAQTGNPVIHEMVHVVAGDGRGSYVGDVNHKDSALWESSGGSSSLECVAKKYYLKLRGQDAS